MLHPALPDAPGHALWKRDFTGACSLFGVVFQPQFSAEATHAMVESLELFGIGASWGGYESLAVPTTGFITRTAGTGNFGRAGACACISASKIPPISSPISSGGLVALRDHRD